MNKKNKGTVRNTLYYVLILLAMVMVVYFFLGNGNSQTPEIEYSKFVQQLKNGDIKEFKIQPANGVYRITGEYAEEQSIENNNGLSVLGSTQASTTRFTTIILPNDSTLENITSVARENGIATVIAEESTSGIWVSLLVSFLPLVIFIFFFYMMMSQQGGGGGGGGGRGVMNFGKSKAKEADKKDVKVRFSDVAGAEEEKQELVEVVEFLKDPRRFVALGARIPAGVLLEGPPGTGKTLLAKAVAGEAGVPFYSISGSDFVEMFVGVGASRVRDLFETAKKNAPAIIFIDEIDAVGRQRGAGMGGGHDEREQTLNQLLVEMDGFGGNEGVIVIAATNRSDVLDPALLRPGRFDRQILVGRPDVKGREAILRVHARNKPLAPDVDLKIVAQQTPGFAGAELENVLNEAALVAARRNKKQIDASDIDEAQDRVIAGPAKKDRAINKKEREMIAYHEAGHTICGLVLSRARFVHKVTIIPRGQAGGYTMMLPHEERSFITKAHLLAQLRVALGGRCAEQIVFKEISSGASGDLQQVTGILRKMIMEWGMSDRLGPMIFGEHQEQIFLGKQLGSERNYGETVATIIDEEMHKYLDEAYNDTMRILTENIEVLEAMAQALLEVETINHKQVENLFKYHSIYAPGEEPKQEESEFSPPPMDDGYGLPSFTN